MWGTSLFNYGLDLVVQGLQDAGDDALRNCVRAFQWEPPSTPSSPNGSEGGSDGDEGPPPPDMQEQGQQEAAVAMSTATPAAATPHGDGDATPTEEPVSGSLPPLLQRVARALANPEMVPPAKRSRRD